MQSSVLGDVRDEFSLKSLDERQSGFPEEMLPTLLSLIPEKVLYSVMVRAGKRKP